MNGSMIGDARRSALWLALVVAGGCAGSTQGPPADPQPTATLAQGKPVTLLEEVGDFAKVEDSDGKQWYVAASLLKHRNTAEGAQEASFTHTVVRDTPSYDKLPAGTPPALEPRAVAEIDAEQLTLNALFISEKTGKEVIAPRNVPYFVVDEETDERCWHAYECIHPDCPGEHTGGRPHFLFIVPRMEQAAAIHCPACQKIRDPSKETKQEWQKWGTFVRPYELPETLRRRAELDQERRQWRERRRRGGRRA